ncbi:glycine zipper family protein [Quadrisphaera granulorum]|uniref:glycine zipper family protein n=1 Tax=Quadrisphaera granulorum TaxID=317664 RepID=UPI0011B501AF|nr:glycine zipper family protein [Quadrisphaera granulorum]
MSMGGLDSVVAQRERYGDGEHCPQCGAEGTQRIRRRLTSSVPHWLVSGDQLFSQVRECSACRYRWPGVFFFGRGDVSRWQLPWRAARAVVVTLHEERTVHPVPWFYLASTAIGAGTGAALGSWRSSTGSTARGAAVGAASGWLMCWSVFAATALRQYGVGTALADAVLVQVGDPQRNNERHARRDEEQAASAGFTPYGLDASWQGRRYLAGVCSAWTKGRQPPHVTELVLAHTTSTASPGAPGWDEGVRVTTLAPRDATGPGRTPDHRWELTAEELLGNLGWEFESGSEDDAPVQRRAVVVVLDGTAVEVTALHGDDRWVVLLRTTDAHVEVRGTGEVPDDLRLERVRDLSAYPSSLRLLDADDEARPA